MNIVKEINHFRRSLFTGATKGMVKNAPTISIEDPSTIKKLLICRPNQRLGNLLLITPLLQEIELYFPGAQVDLIVKGGLAKTLFAQYPSIKNIYKLPKKPFMQPITYLKNYFKAISNEYDLVINATDDSSSGRILTKKSKGRYKLFGKPLTVYWADKSDKKHIAKKPVMALKELLGKGRGCAIPKLDLRLSIDELIKGKEILEGIATLGKKTICIFTFATGNKMHSKDWWNKLYLEMKLNFKDYNIVEILPIENVSQIDFKAPTLYSQDIRELGAVIAASEVFVGADSGIMHLASSVDVPTLGFFNVTDIDMYCPYNELSQAINTNQADVLEIIEQLKLTLELKKHSSREVKTQAIA